MSKNLLIVTGASGGIGSVLVNDLSKKFIVFATDKIIDKKNRCFLQADLSSEEDCDKIIHEARIILKTRHIRLAGIINNGATQRLSPLEDLRMKDYLESFQVNVLAAWKISSGLFPELKKSHGVIVNMSSIHGKLTKKCFGAYASSKAALDSLTRSMAIEWGQHCRVYGIAPAAISTAMLSQGFKDSKKPELLSKLAHYHPTKRIGQPHEISVLCEFLVNHGPHFLNGSIISLDGGIGGVLHDPV